MTATTPLETLPGFFGNTRSQLKRRTLLFRYLAIINLALGGWYLSWRVVASINWHDWWVSGPLLLAEIYSYIGGVLFILGLWRPLVRQVRSLSRLMPQFSPSQWPTVDVFIACCNEPVYLVEKTAKAALAIDYPVDKLRVYILDDGASSDMEAMANQLRFNDLRSPAIQTLSNQLQTEHYEQLQKQQALKAALGELEQLSPESTPPENAYSHPLLHRITTLLNPTALPLRQQLLNEITELQQSLGDLEHRLSDLPRCRYIARPKPVDRPHHAKAGNINHALFSGQTSGEFILTLDADHIPKPQFLQRVLPYFFDYNLRNGLYESNAIAFVQTPQSFYNLPANDPFCHRAHLFYGPIQQGKDGLNAAFYTGTNAVLRREALVTTGLQNFSQVFEQDNNSLTEFELIGGLSSCSITEDMNTAMRLHAAGWRSIYHNEILAVGLAPDDLSATLKQRLRWAQGTLQVLQTENPLTKPGLSFWQRLQYFQTMYSYFSGFATVILLICPLVYFFTGIIPVEAFGSDFLIHFVPAYLINRITFMTIAWGISAREIWRSEQYAVALFPLFIQSVWSVFLKRPLTFQVTPKQRQSGNYLKLVWPQIVLFVLLIVGMLWGGWKLATGNSDHPGTYWVNMGWSLYSLCLLWSVIRAAVWSPGDEEVTASP